MDKRTIWKTAKKMVSQPLQLKRLMEDVTSKLKYLPSEGINLDELRTRAGTLLRMLKAYREGSYRSFSPKTILLVTFALVYFITPTDAIPDFIPALGLTDDLSIIYLIYKRIKEDMNAYLNWENNLT